MSAYPIVGFGHGGAKPPVGRWSTFSSTYRPVCMPPRSWAQWEMVITSNSFTDQQQGDQSIMLFGESWGQGCSIDLKMFYAGHKYFKVTPAIMSGNPYKASVSLNSGSLNNDYVSYYYEDGWSKEYSMTEVLFYRTTCYISVTAGFVWPHYPGPFSLKLSFSWAD